ncbi:hypothetical protein ACFWP2_14135 [Kitasatospora sp. NPDC058444]|uniref:hypothetical protein n=1 Tax=Kitasatospora sp. NPDC058444 TaxID=3346504 RepID=UPI00364E3D47
MVGEEQRGEPERRVGGFRLPAVNWALAAEADPGVQAAPAEEPASAATAVLPAPAPSAAGATGGVTGGARTEPKAESEPDPESEPEPEGGTGYGPAVLPSPVTAAAAPAAPEAVALAAGAASDPAGESAADPGPRPGRVSRPMIAAAVAVGLVLVGTSVVVTQLGGNDPKHGPAQADAPPGYGQGGGDGGNGYVPGFDQHGGSIDPANPTPDGQPGAVVPPLDGSASPAPGDQAAAAPNGAGGTGGAGAGAAARPGGVANPGGGGGGSAGGADHSQGGSGSASGGSGGSGGANPAPNQPAPNQPAPNKPAPNQPAPNQPAPPPAAAKPPAPVTVIAGPYCSSGGQYKTNGWFDQGNKGWRNNSGGYSGDGCNGTYASMPMSGDANKDDNSNSVVWTFTVDKASSCTLSVYIPGSSDVKQVGGNPSYYTVQSGGGQIGSFSINQTASRGSWVNQGPFSYRGPISVTLHSRGLDWSGSTETFAHHAAGAVRATCTV